MAISAVPEASLTLSFWGYLFWTSEIAQILALESQNSPEILQRFLALWKAWKSSWQNFPSLSPDLQHLKLKNYVLKMCPEMEAPVCLQSSAACAQCSARSYLPSKPKGSTSLHILLGLQGCPTALPFPDVLISTITLSLKINTVCFLNWKTMLEREWQTSEERSVKNYDY